jgi:hypothetical protein
MDVSGQLQAPSPILLENPLNEKDFAAFICLSIYGSTALVDLGRFFSFLICTQSVGLLGRGISPSQGRYLHRTTQNTE